MFDHVIFQVARRKKENCADGTECRFEVKSLVCVSPCLLSVNSLLQLSFQDNDLDGIGPAL